MNRPDFNLIERMSHELSDMLGDDFDAETFWDTLDGETDVLDIADYLIGKMQDDEALAAAAAAQAEQITKRRKRIEDRAGAIKRQLLTLLDATGQKKLERPRATISRRSGSMSVRIINDADIPSQLCTVKTTTAPDKTAIKRQIEAGEDVPGAELVRGPDGIIVRVA